MSSYGVFVAGPFDPIRGLSSDAMDENLSGFDQSSLRSSVGFWNRRFAKTVGAKKKQRKTKPDPSGQISSRPHTTSKQNGGLLREIPGYFRET